MARGYSDTWGVNSATLGFGYSQYFGNSLLLRTDARIYQQSEATFFKDAFFYETEGSAGAFFTGDRELGAIRNIVGGAKLSYIKVNASGEPVWGIFDELMFNLKADLYLLDELPAVLPGVDASGHEVLRELGTERLRGEEARHGGGAGRDGWRGGRTAAPRRRRRSGGRWWAGPARARARCTARGRRATSAGVTSPEP